MKLFKRGSEKMIIDNENLVSAMEREGWEFAFECDEKGKEIKLQDVINEELNK